MAFNIENRLQQQVRSNTLTLDVLQPQSVFFVKPGTTDSNLAANQDRITDNVWLTRLSENDVSGGNGIIYNAKLENRDGTGGLEQINTGVSPRGTGWTFGNWDDIKNYLDKVTFSSLLCLSGNLSEIDKVLVGNTLVMYSEADNQYYQFKILRYSGNNGTPRMELIYTRTIQPLQVPPQFSTFIPTIIIT